MPGKRMVVTPLSNLHIYTQRNTRQRKAELLKTARSTKTNTCATEGYAVEEPELYAAIDEDAVTIGTVTEQPEGWINGTFSRATAQPANRHRTAPETARRWIAAKALRMCCLLRLKKMWRWQEACQTAADRRVKADVLLPRWDAHRAVHSGQRGRTHVNR